jgi:hypothetical protein
MKQCRGQERRAQTLCSLPFALCMPQRGIHA